MLQPGGLTSLHNILQISYALATQRIAVSICGRADKGVN